MLFSEGQESLFDSGCWAQLYRLPSERSRPALFLDRDGVIVHERHYLCRPHDTELIGGVAEAIACANRMNIPVVVVTNQAGIGRGYYDWDDFRAVQHTLLHLLAEKGAFIDAAFACAFHPHANPPYRRDNHLWRKPNPGMILQASKELSIDLTGSLLVGDAVTDIRAAIEARLGFAALVRTGHGNRDIENNREKLLYWKHFLDLKLDIYDDAAQAIMHWMNISNKELVGLRPP